MSDLIKVSDIRAKFPMYGDLTDEQLLGAVRKKFYADIPMAQFVKRIDFDTERARLNPTNDMGAFETAAAGYGKSVVDLARGVGQALGLVSRGDVAESRKLDAPLMETTAGKVGNVAGNVANTLPLAFAPGANTLAGAGAYGALTGLMAPSEGTGETLANVGMGGALGPAAMLAGRGVGAAYQGVKGLVEPLTKKGQEAVAAKTLQSFAKDPAAAAAAIRSAKQLVPGSVPTMAQASGDAGLAQLERTLANNPETGPALAGRFADQRAARLGAVQSIAGTDDYFKSIKEGISTFAKEDYGAAIKAGFDPKALEANKDQLAKLLARPSVESAKAVAARLAKENGEDITELGSVKGLDYLIKALDNKISSAKALGSSVGKVELRALVGTKDELMQVVEQIAPAYKQARVNFAAMSKPANAMQAAREVLDKMQSPLGRFGAGTRELKNEYARALENATTSVKRSTGMDMPLSSVMPTKDIAALENVGLDMARAAKAEDLGRAVGSNTAQNLSSQNLLRRALGPTGLPQSYAESTALQTLLSPVTGVYKLGGAEQKILERLANAALDTNDTAALLLFQRHPDWLERLAPKTQRLLAPAVASGLLAQPGQQ